MIDPIKKKSYCDTEQVWSTVKTLYNDAVKYHTKEFYAAYSELIRSSPHLNEVRGPLDKLKSVQG